MSFADDTRSLLASFRATHGLMQQLLAGLQTRRASWVSARPSLLQPSVELEQLTQDIAREESRREELLARIRTAMPRPLGGEAAELHLNVTRIAAAMPATDGRALRDAADAATRIAKAVRTEVTLGQRLVRFAQDTQPGLLVPAKNPANKAGIPGYDRRARALRFANTAGALIDGRM